MVRRWCGPLRASGAAALLAVCQLAGCTTLPNPAYERDSGQLAPGPVPDAAPVDAPAVRDAGWSPDSWSFLDTGTTDTGTTDARTADTSLPAPVPGLVGHWRFDEGGGTIARDSSGSGHDGTLEGMGSAPWVAAPGGSGGLSFPGTLEAAVRVKATAAIDAIRSFTIAAWIKRGWEGGGMIHHSVLSRQLGTGNDELFNLSCQQTDAVVYISRSRGQIVQARAPLTVPADAWLHLAGSYDGRQLVLYQNGAEIARTTGLDVQLTGSTTDLLIGSNHNNTLPSEAFLGVIDEVVLFSKALGAEAIKTLAQRGTPAEAERLSR